MTRRIAESASAAPIGVTASIHAAGPVKAAAATPPAIATTAIAGSASIARRSSSSLA
ncbi:MAG TPA: hypothetical protein VFP36_04240 [Usitatibacter sp.]|nr:hypothetical protein [Usitatibacter sp.]